LKLKAYGKPQLKKKRKEGMLEGLQEKWNGKRQNGDR